MAVARQAPGAGMEAQRVFAGASVTHGEQAEVDELDIPAFLRRSH